MRWSWFQKANKDISIFKYEVIRNWRWKIKGREMNALSNTVLAILECHYMALSFQAMIQSLEKTIPSELWLSGTLLFWIPPNGSLCKGMKSCFHSLNQNKYWDVAVCISIVLGIIGESKYHRNGSCGYSPKPHAASGSSSCQHWQNIKEAKTTNWHYLHGRKPRRGIN